MAEQQEELQQYWNQMDDDDRTYFLGVGRFLAARGARQRKTSPTLTPVVGGRGESFDSHPQGLHDGFAAFNV